MIIGKTTLAGVGSVRRKAMMPATKPWSCGGASRSQAGFAVEMNSGGQAQRNLLPGGRAGLVALADVLLAWIHRNVFAGRLAWQLGSLLAVAGRRIQKVHDLGSRNGPLTRGSAGA
jgi:hypothetical protein